MSGKRRREADTPSTPAKMPFLPRPDEDAMYVDDESSEPGLPLIQVLSGGEGLDFATRNTGGRFAQPLDSAHGSIREELEAMPSEPVPPGIVPTRRGSESGLYGDQSDVLAFREVLRSEYSVRGDRRLNLEGKYIADIAKAATQSGEQNMNSNFGSIEPLELLATLKGELEPTEPSCFPRPEGNFLPCTRLHRLLSTETVLKLLKYLNDASKTGARLREDHQIQKMAPDVAPPLSQLGSGKGVNGQCRRTLAVLILANQAPKIFEFCDAGFNDEMLLDMTFNNLKPNNPKLTGLFSGWTDKEIKDFKQYRWQLTPTFLADSQLEDDKKNRTFDHGERSEALERRVRYRLQSTEEVLPFQDGDDGAVEMSGGYGNVRVFKLHRDQQNLLRYTKGEEDHPIAVKTLKNDFVGTQEQRKAFEDEVYVMERLADRIKSPHISKLLTTLESPSSSSIRTHYHLVMEAADMSLDKLWEDQTWWTVNDVAYPDLARWVSHQCYGLADVLWNIHEFPRKASDKDMKTHGHHCDIKPDNILCYKNWKTDRQFNPMNTVDEKLGVLQLSDFGLSTFHSTKSAENHQLSANSSDYAAPETVFLRTHPPIADVWHLGCLFVDFATWLVDGPKGYRVFRKRRATFEQGKVEKSRFFRSVACEEGDYDRIEVNPEVLKQATYLYNHPRSSEFIRELCHLAVNYMLVIRNPLVATITPVAFSLLPQDVADRLTSSKVAEALKKVMSCDKAYFEPSSAPEAAPFEDQTHQPFLVLPRSVMNPLREIRLASLGSRAV